MGRKDWRRPGVPGGQVEVNIVPSGSLSELVQIKTLKKMVSQRQETKRGDLNPLTLEKAPPSAGHV